MSHGIAISHESIEAILSEFRRHNERIEARYKMLLEHILPMVPTLFSDEFGKRNLGRDPSIERFLATLTPEQIDAITRTLGVEQSAMLVEIAKRYSHVPPVDPEKVEQA